MVKSDGPFAHVVAAPLGAPVHTAKLDFQVLAVHNAFAAGFQRETDLGARLWLLAFIRIYPAAVFSPFHISSVDTPLRRGNEHTTSCGHLPLEWSCVERKSTAETQVSRSRIVMLKWLGGATIHVRRCMYFGSR